MINDTFVLDLVDDIRQRIADDNYGGDILECIEELHKLIEIHIIDIENGETVDD